MCLAALPYSRSSQVGHLTDTGADSFEVFGFGLNHGSSGEWRKREGQDKYDLKVVL